MFTSSVNCATVETHVWCVLQASKCVVVDSLWSLKCGVVCVRRQQVWHGWVIVVLHVWCVLQASKCVMVESLWSDMCGVVCYRPASVSWMSHCGATRVVCVTGQQVCHGRVIVVLHVWCGVCYRPASVAWSSHCGPTRVVWCVLQASKCVMVEPLCVTGQQVRHGWVIVVLHVWCGVVWCVLQASKWGVVESLWSYTCSVVCVTGQQVCHDWATVCYRPASVAWLSHCGPTRVVWCVLQASKWGVVESLWSYTCSVVCVTGQQVCHGWATVCYRPASVAWSSHCGPTRVVWCVLQASKWGVVESLWSYTCGVVCVTGQQVWRGWVIVVLHVWCGVCYRPASVAWSSQCSPGWGSRLRRRWTRSVRVRNIRSWRESPSWTMQTTPAHATPSTVPSSWQRETQPSPSPLQGLAWSDATTMASSRWEERCWMCVRRHTNRWGTWSGHKIHNTLRSVYWRFDYHCVLQRK